MNAACPICLDLFDGHNIVSTPCGHVFHFKCICKWIDNSKFCPECRATVTRNDVAKLFFNIAHSETPLSYPTLLNDLNSKKAELREKKAELAASNKSMQYHQRHTAVTEELYNSVYQKYLASQSEVRDYKLQCNLLKHRQSSQEQKFEGKLRNIMKKNATLQSQVSKFKQYRNILLGRQQEAEVIVRELGISLAQEVGGQISQSMIDVCVILKRELCKVEAQKEKYKVKKEELLYLLDLETYKLKRCQAELEKQLRRLD